MAMAQQEEQDLRNHLIHVNCPRDNYNNPEEVMGSQQAAFAIFRRLCPPGAEVASVVGIRKKGRRYKCAWRVRYIKADNNQIGSEELVWDIMNSKPNNTDIVRKDRHIYPPTIEIDYSITCRCTVSPHAGKVIKKDDPVEKIKVELINLKWRKNNCLFLFGNVWYYVPMKKPKNNMVRYISFVLGMLRL